jgi:MFS family permease
MLFIAATSFGMVVGLVMLALAPSLRSAGAAIALCGLCYAPIFPTTVGVGHSLYPKFFGTVFGILMGGSLVGGLVMPTVVGYVAGTASMRAGIWVLVGSATLMVLVEVLFLRTEQTQNLP